jgi:hypothetical protein
MDAIGTRLSICPNGRSFEGEAATIKPKPNGLDIDIKQGDIQEGRLETSLADVSSSS